jgi:hypothetical protein
MAIHTPPSWLQNGSHPAENDRLTTQALYATTGIIGSSSLAVSANSPAGMSVVVASGWAAIIGDIQPNMGSYVGFNDDDVVLTIATANPTNPRIDVVCMTVNDSYYTGALDNVVLQVIQGTAAGSPVAPAIPDNSITLANVLVGATVTQINTGNITDTRVAVTSNLDISSLPPQAGNGGKYLTTNGSAASWATITTDPTPTVFMLMGA